uniref:Uncharacterized protein n=1 Tax=Arundo donax TaxID=35708 RepID=A0A0A8YRJ9_ARUDO
MEKKHFSSQKILPELVIS